MQRVTAALAVLLLGGAVLLWIAGSPAPESAPAPEPAVAPQVAPPPPAAAPSAAAAGTAPALHTDPALLAQTHCARCHALPAAELLPREQWRFVLRWMGNYLGLRDLDGRVGDLAERAWIPPQQLISPRDWQELQAWYIAAAPERLVQPAAASFGPPLERFEVVVPETGLKPPVHVTALHVDPRQGRVYVGTPEEDALRIFDRRWRAVSTAPIGGDPVQVVPRLGGGEIRVTVLGDFERDRSKGAVLAMRVSGVEGLVLGHPRLVEHHAADLDGDGREDILTVGFGDHGHGRVAVRWGGAGPEADTELTRESGVLAAAVRDFDADGRLDVLLLQAQGRNALLLHRGEGSRRFARQVLHQEHAAFGYNHMLLADLDGDGVEDLVTCAGNNMELDPPPLRPWHGVRVLRGAPGAKFEQVFYFPMHGAQQTVAADFDADGDPDLVAISFYPDWSLEAPEALVYLENQGGMKFTARRLAGVPFGRWMRMAAGDVDGDGKVDLVLGAGASPLGLGGGAASPWFERVREGAPVVWLRNRG